MTTIRLIENNKLQVSSSFTMAIDDIEKLSKDRQYVEKQLVADNRRDFR